VDPKFTKNWNDGSRESVRHVVDEEFVQALVFPLGIRNWAGFNW
jgi:hypothetical protein